MHTVVETAAYLADAKAAGMTEHERNTVVEMIASHPEAGDEISGTGGARKVRVAGREGEEWWVSRDHILFRRRPAGVFVGCLFEGRESESE